ncbi:efflux transporter outer membrane subunit [Sandaracinus amylolyticus]|uniref:RND efflux system, outer membrane lipoprotein CmeC n=1 Tax=Sandaracinus amylolyticus TaxID=927083 RepID=A0A0F6YMQ9_9BACT|nr:efflux transporter outer membrane subunit [Sandaracinus amylolyticus]AKF10982.1 RND efflux system, outer membrane lipoprotein CmeC [Sandaracinus amylolyticus]
MAPPTAKHADRDAKRAVLVVWMLVSGCMVGPEYARPEVPLASSWTESGDPRLSTNATVDVAWWTSFEDPALDRLIDLAYRQDLSLQIARLRIEESRAQVGVAIAEMFPRNPSPVASGSVAGITRSGGTNIYGQYLFGFDATWELDLWGRQRRGVRAARADFLAQVADYQDAIVSLNAEIARSYVLVRTFERLIEQAEANATLQQQAQEIASARFRHGATSELDVAQATTLLETTRATIPGLRVGHQQALNALSTLLGRPRGYVEPLLAESRGIPSAPQSVAVGVPAELLRRRPDIRAAELRAIAQCNRVGEATADLYPSFSLTGFLGTSAVVGAGAEPALGRVFGPGTLLYSFGGSLLWPLLNYPQILENIEVQDARYAQSLLEYARTVLVAAQEVEDGIVGFLLSGEAVQFSTSAVTAAELAVNLALIQYREGATDFMRVVDTTRVLLEAQNRLTESLSTNTTNAIALYKALGGGWEIAREEGATPERPARDTERAPDARPTERPARSRAGGGADWP